MKHSPVFTSERLFCGYFASNQITALQVTDLYFKLYLYRGESNISSRSVSLSWNSAPFLKKKETFKPNHQFRGRAGPLPIRSALKGVIIDFQYYMISKLLVG